MINIYNLNAALELWEVGLIVRPLPEHVLAGIVQPETDCYLIVFLYARDAADASARAECFARLTNWELSEEGAPPALAADNRDPERVNDILLAKRGGFSCVVIAEGLGFKEAMLTEKDAQTQS